MIKDELKIDEEDDDEYTPQEELTTVLSDCLRRYPPATAFNEYVANAEDCRASKLAWTIDDCEACTYPTERLMTKELECVQGPSLFVYNDGVFSEADFEGFKQIGRGSKSESETSIGMYGRGAITMYHFTDVPMILSGSTFLILDPQQTLLPRNKFNKRKVGVKVSLTRARRAFPDHLVPFEGLWGYTAATDHFNGTIFRFPLRSHSQVSSLVDVAYFLTIEKIKMLLEKYFKTAQVAMLFLKNVRSLGYQRRANQGHRWYVQSIPEPFSEKNLIQKMIITSWDLNKSSYEDHWLIATHDNNVPAQMVTMDIPSKLRHKKIQCGVAACPASTYKTEHSIFCTLPTAFTSSLPVSFHGIFAITGDRQTIPHGDTSRGSESQWNKWLLAQCIPQLYLGFLQETCKRWPDLAYRLWPNGTVDETSKVVRDSFWAMLGDKQNSSLRLFPLVSSQELIAHGNRSTAVSLHDAQFEFLQDNSFKKLKPLLLKLFPKLVKLPANLHGPIQQLIKSGKIKKVAYLSEQYLCEIFQDEDACEKLKTDLQVERKVHAKETWINLMNNMIPASNLNSFAQMISVGSVGCRILPTRSGKLGKLMPQCNSCAATTYLRGTINETEVFSFAGDLFVDNEFEKPIVPSSGGGPTILSPLDPIISSGLFNVRKMEAKDAGGLLKHADSPLTNASPAEKHRFLFNFWEYFNPKLTALLDTAGLKDSSHKEALEQCGLEDMPIYATGSLESPNFIAPADFDDGPYMLEPSTPANRSLCEKIPGLQLVHRFLVPKALREAEMDICSPPSFKRFIRCLMRLTKNDPEAIEEFVATNLKHEQLKLLRGALSDYLPQSDDNSLLPVLRMLPVWPRMETAAVGPSKQYISAQNATVVQDKDMIHPWVKDLETWIDPETSTTEKHILDKLGKKPLPMKDVWKKVSADFPPDAVLAQTQFEKYRNFIETLKKGDIKPEIPIAPDGTGKLCRPKFLFDDTESIFMAAFRLKEDTKFIHKDVRSFKEYWKLIGLRHRRNDGAIRQHDYRACIKALHERSTSTAFSTDPDFLADARHVLEYVTWKRKEFDIWESSTWKEIVTTPVFKVKPHHDPMSYRQPRMRELAAKQDYISVDAAGLEKYLTISWSQVPFLDLEPVPLAYGDIPRQGAPSVHMVVQHLEFLVRIREIVPKSELTSFLEDVQASYAHLQKYCHQLNSKHKAATAAIWLNLETTDVEQIAQRDLDTAATTVSRLCFHCPVNPPGMRRVRAFLIPYERLLKALGAKIVVQPPIPAPTETDADKQSPKEVTMDSISALRAENRFFDVTLKVDNDKREIQAHRLVLGASSSFFRASSSAVWKQPFITVSEVSFEDLKTILDFFYTGVVSLPAVSDQEPVASIADKLDHCLDLLHTADYLQIPRLHRTLENFILKESRVFVRPDNVRHLIKLADQDNAKNLKKYCVVYEENNRDVVEGCEQLEADEGNS